MRSSYSIMTTGCTKVPRPRKLQLLPESQEVWQVLGG